MSDQPQAEAAAQNQGEPPYRVVHSRGDDFKHPHQLDLFGGSQPVATEEPQQEQTAPTGPTETLYVPPARGDAVIEARCSDCSLLIQIIVPYDHGRIVDTNCPRCNRPHTVWWDLRDVQEPSTAPLTEAAVEEAPHE